MPHSYGASFADVGLRGPRSFDARNENEANNTTRTIMVRIGSQSRTPRDTPRTVVLIDLSVEFGRSCPPVRRLSERSGPAPLDATDIGAEARVTTHAPVRRER